jgi:hypothetical protein
MPTLLLRIFGLPPCLSLLVDELTSERVDKRDYERVSSSLRTLVRLSTCSLFNFQFIRLHP